MLLVALDQTFNALLDSAAGQSPHLGYEGQGTACGSLGFSTRHLPVSFICALEMGQPVVPPSTPSFTLAGCLISSALSGALSAPR